MSLNRTIERHNQLFHFAGQNEKVAPVKTEVQIYVGTVKLLFSSSIDELKS